MSLHQLNDSSDSITNADRITPAVSLARRGDAAGFNNTPGPAASRFAAVTRRTDSPVVHNCGFYGNEGIGS